MMNIGVKRILQNQIINVWFIDCDIYFGNVHWVNDTLKLLSSYDIIQMFNICLVLDSNGETMACYHSFGYQYHHHHKKLFSSGTTNYSHSGYAWCFSSNCHQWNGIFVMEVKKDKWYDTRHNILIQNKYDANKHLKHNKEGLLQFFDFCPEKLKFDLHQYFICRKEDL